MECIRCNRDISSLHQKGKRKLRTLEKEKYFNYFVFFCPYCKRHFRVYEDKTIPHCRSKYTNDVVEKVISIVKEGVTYDTVKLRMLREYDIRLSASLICDWVKKYRLGI